MRTLNEVIFVRNNNAVVEKLNNSIVATDFLLIAMVTIKDHIQSSWYNITINCSGRSRRVSVVSTETPF